MKRLLAPLLSLGLVTVMAVPALAYDFPNTNDENRTEGLPHVDEVSQGVGSVTLNFINDTNSLAFFEYRLDGEVLTSGTPHPVVTGDYIYPGVSVESRDIPDPVVVERTFHATEKVEVRLALGGERDWDFDWTEFDVAPDATEKMDCTGGGWEAYGFENQGQCVRFLTSGKDSR